RRRFRHQHWQRWHAHRQRWEQRYKEETSSAGGTDEDFIDSTAVMGGVKKNVLSKKFRGGDITNVFGGTELNLMQADFEGTASLELTQVFGGTKLIVPANWQIKSDFVTVFGSIEDKRPVNPGSEPEPGKLL